MLQEQIDPILRRTRPTADRSSDQRDDATTAQFALLVGSALLVPIVLVFGLLITLILKLTVPVAAKDGLTFLSRGEVRPEPGEQHAYLLLLLAPLLLSAGLIALHKLGCVRRLRRTTGWLPPVAAAGQSLVLSLVLISLSRQQSLYPYFHGWQLAIAAVAGLVVAGAVVVPTILSKLRRLMGLCRWPTLADGHRRRFPARFLWFGLALVATMAYLSTTVYTDGNIALALAATKTHVPFTSEEFSAVLDGLTPLVNFTPQYTSLLPYVAAPVFSVMGMTIGSFTGVMAVFSAVGLISVFVALTRVTGGAARATLLYLPFLAMTFYPSVRSGAQVSTIGSYYALLPIRYLFPLLLTALVVAHAVSSHRWRSALLLGTVGGAGLVNNVDFGIPALGGVVVAIFVAEAARRVAIDRWRAVVAAELRAMAGVVLAVAVFSVGTLVRSGSLPDFRELVYFSQQFAVSGFYMLPMPGPLGLHLVMYLTFVLALVLAISAAVLSRADDRRRSRLALLAYSAVFGLGAGSYYVGRSHPLVLIALFSAWALCIVVLAAEVGSRTHEMLAAPFSTRWLLAAPSGCLAVLLVLCSSVISLDGFIVEQPQRLISQTAAKTFAAVDMERLVADCTLPGEDVMLIFPLGHRIAYDNGVFDYFPYNHPDSVVTTRQVAAVADGLRANRLSAVFSGHLRPELVAALGAEGYRPVLERQPTVAAGKAEATGATGLELWRPAGALVECR